MWWIDFQRGQKACQKLQGEQSIDGSRVLHIFLFFFYCNVLVYYHETLSCHYSQCFLTSLSLYPTPLLKSKWFLIVPFHSVMWFGSSGNEGRQTWRINMADSENLLENVCGFHLLLHILIWLLKMFFDFIPFFLLPFLEFHIIFH